MSIWKKILIGILIALGLYYSWGLYLIVFRGYDSYWAGTISADELKYAAEHYVKDTGIDNNMTSLFSQLKQAASKDSRIWEKMATWISKTSPIATCWSNHK